ncbi:hypothetical protein [Actinomycetospora sp. NBRC 106375]|uniref:DUF7714 family protein n=1 Tax=Actinomycetospora sp. NBRC 106375 TaxID=3032207 RepID=UPI00255221AA|nr:hypothetical protein [Actinomycetospora sp. NBRC 106375]
MQRVERPDSLADLVDRIRARPVYRRTALIVARWGVEAALLAVRTEEEGEGLFRDVVDVRLLAAPEEIVWIEDGDVDVGNATALAAAAARHQADGVSAYVVHGRHSHVNMIWRPAPVPVVVDEVVPPHPPKLVDMVHRAIDVDEDLPPLQLRARLVSLPARVRAGGPGRYLLPCAGAGPAPGTTTSTSSSSVDYLDDGPPVRGDWTLIGCERSAQIHEHHYGDRPLWMDFCPAKLPAVDGPRVTKCCLLERGLQVREQTAVVPWGATHDEVRDALKAVTQQRPDNDGVSR